MGSYGEIYSSEVKECDGKGVWKINGNTRTFRGKWIANKDIYKKYFSKTIQALTHFLQFFLIFKIYYLIFFFFFVIWTLTLRTSNKNSNINISQYPFLIFLLVHSINHLSKYSLLSIYNNFLCGFPHTLTKSY